MLVSHTTDLSLQPMTNSQLCFLIGNLWLMAPVVVPSDNRNAASVYLVIGGGLLVLSLILWARAYDQRQKIKRPTPPAKSAEPPRHVRGWQL